MKTLNENKLKEKLSKYIINTIGLTFIFIFFSGCIVIGYQIYFWLDQGYWKPISVFFLLKHIMPTTFLDWITDTTSWLGLKKIISGILAVPLGWFLIIFAVCFYFGAGLLLCSFDKKPKKET